MQFTVPQFIEHEVRIVGPLTFKQFIFMGIAGAVCFCLYFLIAKTHFFLFLILSILIFGIATVMAFLKIGGQSFTTVLVNLFRFTLGPKLYIWKRKEILITTPIKMKVEKEVKEEELPLKIAGNSQLKKLKIKIETKTR